MRTYIFMGGREIGRDCLKALISRNVPPTLVIGEPTDSGEGEVSLVREARAAGIETITGTKIKDPALIARLRALAPEVIFCIGSVQLIPKEVLEIPALGVLNIHPALLPKYRGRYSTVHALVNGEKETGVTVQWMSETMDDGPIILQRAYPIEATDTGKTLWEKFTKAGTELFETFIDDLWLPGKDIPTRIQNEADATYFPKGLPNGGQIDWSWDGPTIERFIRAMTFPPYPGAFYIEDGKKMEVVWRLLDDKNTQ